MRHAFLYDIKASGFKNWDAAPVAAGGGFWEWIAVHPFETAALGCGVVLIVGGSVYALNRWHQNRQEAAIPETPVVPAFIAA
jgi:hypothetical protein